MCVCVYIIHIYIYIYIYTYIRTHLCIHKDNSNDTNKYFYLCESIVNIIYI